ncbi:MAG: hypothetical protein MK212_02580 [Saprospiraceae bacterium]|nr:hypothetical protein [Saprospiraceae bacterium]
MSKHQVIDILRRFSKIERKRFGLFINSPYHNSSTHLVKLSEYILNEKIIRLEDLYQLLYPSQVYKRQTINNLLSMLQKQINQFLELEFQAKNKQVEQTLNLLSIYRKRKLPKAYHKQEIQLKKQLVQAEILDVEGHYLHYQKELEWYTQQESINPIAANNLQQLMHHFDIHYIANTLRYAVIALAHQRVSQKKYSFALLDVILAKIEQENYLEEPCIALYYYAYQVMHEGNDINFNQLKEKIMEYWKVFDEEMIRSLLRVSINYCIRQINKSRSDFLAEIFELYQFGVEKKYLFEDGELSRFTYKNIVSTAIKLKAYQQLKDFIDQHTQDLHPKYQKDYHDFCLAKWYYVSQKNHPKAIELLSRIDLEDLWLQIDTKVTLAKVYYESKEYEALDYLLDSFKRYIKRHKKLSPVYQNSYLQFISFLQQLTKLTMDKKNAQESLKKALLDAQRLPEKSWLLEQLN